jgi:hypothetical protein
LKNINQTPKNYMGINIYSLLNLKKKKIWKKMKIKIKEIEKKTSFFGILKTKTKGKRRGKQKRYLRKT